MHSFIDLSEPMSMLLEWWILFGTHIYQITTELRGANQQCFLFSWFSLSETKDDYFPYLPFFLVTSVISV